MLCLCKMIITYQYPPDFYLVLIFHKSLLLWKLLSKRLILHPDNFCLGGDRNYNQGLFWHLYLLYSLNNFTSIQQHHQVDSYLYYTKDIVILDQLVKLFALSLSGVMAVLQEALQDTRATSRWPKSSWGTKQDSIFGALYYCW